MMQAAKIIGTGLVTTGLIGAVIGIGVVFGGLILRFSRNPSLRRQLFSYAILGFAFSEATGLFALMVAFSKKLLHKPDFLLINPPSPYSFTSMPVQSKIFLSGSLISKFKHKVWNRRFIITSLCSALAGTCLHYFYFYLYGITVIKMGSSVTSFVYLYTLLLIKKIIEVVYDNLDWGILKMNSTTNPGSSVGSNVANSGDSNNQGERSDFKPSNPLTKEEVKEFSSKISKNNTKVVNTRRSLDSKIEDIELHYSDKLYNSLVNTYETLKTLQGERNKLFGDVIARNGNLSALNSTSLQYPINTHNTLTKAREIIERHGG